MNYIITIRMSDDFEARWDNKVEVIKAIRQYFGSGLRSSKHAADAWVDNYPHLQNRDAFGSWFSIEVTAEMLARFYMNQVNENFNRLFEVKEVYQSLTTYRLES